MATFPSVLIGFLNHLISIGDVDRARFASFQIWHNRGAIFNHRWVLQGEYRMLTGERAITALDGEGRTCLFPESFFLPERQAEAFKPRSLFDYLDKGAQFDSINKEMGI